MNKETPRRAISAGFLIGREPQSLPSAAARRFLRLYAGFLGLTGFAFFFFQARLNSFQLSLAGNARIGDVIVKFETRHRDQKYNKPKNHGCALPCFIPNRFVAQARDKLCMGGGFALAEQCSQRRRALRGSSARFGDNGFGRAPAKIKFMRPPAFQLQIDIGEQFTIDDRAVINPAGKRNAKPLTQSVQRCRRAGKFFTGNL